MSKLLLSQRIAKDINFPRKLKDDNRSTFDVRMRIIKAYKLLVPLTMLNLLDPDSIDLVVEMRKGKDLLMKRVALYKEFSKLPFDTVFIENETGGFLCENIKDSLMITIISDENDLYHTSIVFKGFTEEAFKIELIKHTKHPDDVLDILDAATEIISVLEILLFLNTKNVTKHKYTPSKVENKAVPKPLLPFYTYYILDIFRERKIYENLDEVYDFINSNRKRDDERRASVVRGHFKTRKTGNFFWSSFVRNMENINKGFVDKDYRLKP